MPRTIIEKSYDAEDPDAAAAAAALVPIAAEYRDRHPLPLLLPGHFDLERSNIKDNTRYLSIYDIDMTIRLYERRAQLNASPFTCEHMMQ